MMAVFYSGNIWERWWLLHFKSFKYRHLPAQIRRKALKNKKQIKQMELSKKRRKKNKYWKSGEVKSPGLDIKEVELSRV